ncbi:hypothetical protein FYZ40_10145 [Mobiluncus mulieris]|nr:hypothetical protein [Mobiluncus mulieris]
MLFSPFFVELTCVVCVGWRELRFSRLHEVPSWTLKRFAKAIPFLNPQVRGLSRYRDTCFSALCVHNRKSPS